MGVGRLPEQFEEEVKVIIREASSLKEKALDSLEDDVFGRKSIVNKAVGFLINALMEVKPLAVALKENPVKDEDLDAEDSGVDGLDNRSNYTMYNGPYSSTSNEDT